MKVQSIITVALPLAMIVRGSVCPPEPAESKPLPPLGYSDTIHACACDSSGTKCGWVWVAVNGGQSSCAPGSLLDFIGRGGASSPEYQEAQQRVAANQPHQGAAPTHRETRDEKAERQFLERIQEARTKHSDFNTVVDGFNPNPIMQRAIFRSPVAGELAYYLGQHADERQRIEAMPPDQAVRQIRQIEAKLIAQKN